MKATNVPFFVQSLNEFYAGCEDVEGGQKTEDTVRALGFYAIILSQSSSPRHVCMC